MKLGIVTTVGLGLVIAPHVAQACGGFFCNANQPVNQAAEQIIFAADADAGRITTVVQIQYAGPAEAFAWLLPLPAEPDDIQVSSNLAFNRLQQFSNPTYRLNTTVEGNCRAIDFAPAAGGGGGFSNVDAGVQAGADGGAGPVTVVQEQTVGPFETVVLRVNGTADDLLTWLSDNSYDVGGIGPALLMSYVEQGAVFLALKLTKNSDVGDIRPLSFSYPSTVPMIPIRLTAVAVEADMPILVWVLGDNYAVPTNYLSLELNEARINWFNPAQNYNDVVTEAANEAGGQGFVTEMAAETADAARAVLFDWEAEELMRLAREDWTNREDDLLLRAAGTYGMWDGFIGAVRANLTLEDGVTVAEALRCLQCVFPEGIDDLPGFEPTAFLDALKEQVMDPMIHTRDLIRSQPRFTRMYSTMSAAEMTMDPTFDFNPTIQAYSNQHVGERIIECASHLTQNEAPWRAELPGGQVVRGMGFTWPGFDGMNLPANRVVTMQNTTGAGTVVTDNTAVITQGLDTYNQTIPPASQIPGSGPDNGNGGGGGGPFEGGVNDSCGCSTTSPAGSLAWVGLFLFVALVGRRRR